MVKLGILVHNMLLELLNTNLVLPGPVDCGTVLLTDEANCGLRRTFLFVLNLMLVCFISWKLSVYSWVAVWNVTSIGKAPYSINFSSISRLLMLLMITPAACK